MAEIKPLPKTPTLPTDIGDGGKGLLKSLWDHLVKIHQTINDLIRVVQTPAASTAPAAHRDTHATGGSDALSPADIGAEPANSNIQSHISSTSNPHNTTAAQVLPTQTSNAGKYLTTNGTTASWGWTFPNPYRFYMTNGRLWYSKTGTGDYVTSGSCGSMYTDTTAGSSVAIGDGLSYQDLPVNYFYDGDPNFSILLERVIGDASTQKILRFGVGRGPYDTSNTGAGFGFRVVGNTLYAWNANGTTETITNISAGITITDQNHFHARMASGTNIEFFVNGVLKATHTTNLPTGSEDYCWSMRVNNGTDAADHEWAFVLPNVSFSR
jgi:hypothetical protein